VRLYEDRAFGCVACLLPSGRTVVFILETAEAGQLSANLRRESQTDGSCCSIVQSKSWWLSMGGFNKQWRHS